MMSEGRGWRSRPLPSPGKILFYFFVFYFAIIAELLLLPDKLLKTAESCQFYHPC